MARKLASDSLALSVSGLFRIADNASASACLRFRLVTTWKQGGGLPVWSLHDRLLALGRFRRVQFRQAEDLEYFGGLTATARHAQLGMSADFDADATYGF